MTELEYLREIVKLQKLVIESQAELIKVLPRPATQTYSGVLPAYDRGLQQTQLATRQNTQQAGQHYAHQPNIQGPVVQGHNQQSTQCAAV